MHLLRPIFKTIIALFCLWHMAATGIYALQNVDSQPVLKWLEQKQYIVRPYVLMTSQWQRWNLFSPDPLRRVIEQRVEAETGGIWRTVAVLDFENLSFFRRASELKVLRRMDEEGENYNPLRERYLQDICQANGLQPGTPIRLIKRSQVVPKHEEPQPVSVWQAWNPEWYEALDYQTLCTSS